MWSKEGQGSFVADPIQCGNDHLYDWVNTFVQLDLSAGGAAVVERHEYWAGQFEVMRSFSELDCAWYNLTAALELLRTADEPREIAETVAMPAWTTAMETATDLFRALLESTTNIGEMGVVADLMESKIPSIFNETDKVRIKHDLFCIKNDEGCIQNDAFTRTRRCLSRLSDGRYHPQHCRGKPIRADRECLYQR